MTFRFPFWLWYSGVDGGSESLRRSYKFTFVCKSAAHFSDFTSKLPSSADSGMFAIFSIFRKYLISRENRIIDQTMQTKLMGLLISYIELHAGAWL